MTIRLQNLLIIPPIFLVLGLAVGLLADRAAREEILWGLEEEAVALSVTVAEMTGREVLARVAEGDTAAAAEVRASLAEIARHTGMEAAVLYSVSRRGPVLTFDRDSASSRAGALLRAERLSEVRTHGLLGPVSEEGGGAAALAAAAPIVGEGEGPAVVGVAAVVVDAGRLAALTGELRRDFALLGLLVTALGVAAALFLSLKLGRQVQELRRLGAAVAAGEYRAQVKVSGVKEVQDLSNTLGTMASILSDVVTRGRRALLVGDSFQLARGMAAAYREERVATGGAAVGLDVGSSLIGKPPPGCFHGWAEGPEGVLLWAGELTAGSALDAAVEAAAANRALARGIRDGRGREVAAAVLDLFRPASFQVAVVPARGGGAPSPEVLAGSGVPLRKGDAWVVHSFAAPHTDALSGSLSLFKDLAAEVAARELPLALPEWFHGVLVVFKASPPHIPGDPS